MYKKGASIKFIITVIIIVAILAIFFTFFFYSKCYNMGCFIAHQEECSKAKFTNDAQDATWKYTIKGKSKGQCKIVVELDSVKKGDLDLQILEGQKMTCYLPLGNTASPETDISKCTGKLKEELQTLIINKLHAYVLDNVGAIDSSLEKVI